MEEVVGEGVVEGQDDAVGGCARVERIEKSVTRHEAVGGLDPVQLPAETVDVQISEVRQVRRRRADIMVHQRFHPRSEEHTSELQSLMRISYAVFCLKKKKNQKRTTQELS